MQVMVLIMLCKEMFCAFFRLKLVDKKIELLSVFVLLLLMVKLIHCRGARQSLPCYTAVARLGFKRRATAVRAELSS